MKKNRIRNTLITIAAAAAILLAGCPTGPSNTVNEKLMPFFKVVNGEIVIVKGADLSHVELPSNAVDENGDPVTVFGGYEDDNDKDALKSVTIPDGITEIADNAFSDASSLSRVEFTSSSSVETIGEGAFQKTGITELVIPDSVQTINDNAFSGTQIKDLVISDGVGNIGSGAFADAPIENLTIPADKTGSISDIFGTGSSTGSTGLKDNLANLTVTAGTNGTVAGSSFENFGNLASVTLEEGVTNVGNNAFNGASSLTDVTIPSSVTNLGESSFQGTGITELVIPDSGMSIGNNAFADAPITDLTIPASVTKDGGVATIFGDTGLKDNLTNLTVTGSENGSIIGDSSFSDFGNLSNVKIEDGVTAIGDNAFNGAGAGEGNANGMTIDFGETLETIGTGAFTGAGDENTEYHLPASVTDVASDAFDTDRDKVFIDFEIYNNSTDTEPVLTFEAQVYPTESAQTVAEAIGNTDNHKPGDNFRLDSITDANGTSVSFDTLGDTKLTLPSKDTTGSGSGSTINGNKLTLSWIDGNLNYEEIADASGEYSVGLEDVANSPDSVTVSANYQNGKVTEIANNGFNKPVEVIIPVPNSIDTIGNGAFQGNTAFDKENFDKLFGDGTGADADKTVTIGDNAFNGATGIVSGDKHLVIPGNAASIGSGAFQNTGVEVITIPVAADGNNDRTFENGAFGPSDTLTEVIIEGPDSGLTGQEIADAFGKPNNNVTKLTVPADAVDTPEEVAAIKEAFPNLEELVVTGGTGADGSISGFEGWESLEKVDLSESGITSIEGNAFKDTGLKEVIFPDSLQTIGDSAFEGCDELVYIGTADASTGNVEVRLPEVLESIGNNAFNGTALGTPNGDKTVSGGTLANGGTSNAEITGGIFDGYDGSIGDGAFAGTSIGPVLNLGSVASVGDGAFARTDKNNEGFSVKLPTNATDDIDSFFRASVTNEPASVFIDDLIIVPGTGEEQSIGKVAGENPNTTGNADLVLGNVVVESGVDKVGDSAFVGVGATADNPLNVVLPDTITGIGSNAFQNAALPVDNNGVIQGTADAGKLVITDTNGESRLPSSVTNIGSGAFENSGLVADENGNSIELDKFIPAGNPQIGSNAFAGVDIGDTLVITDNMTLENITDIYGENLESIKNLTVPADLIDNNPTSTPSELDKLIELFPDVENLVISSSTDSKGPIPSGFDGWKNLQSVDLSGSGVTEISDNAFNGLSAVDITLTDTITKVGDNAFNGVASIDSEEFGKLDGLTEIGDGAFAGTGIGTTIVIPDTVTSVGTGAFAGLGTDGKGGTDADNKLNVTLPAGVSGNIDDYFTSEETHDQPVFIGSLTITGTGSVGPVAGKVDENAFDANLDSGKKAELVIDKVVVTEATELADNAFNGVGTVDGSTLTVQLPDGLTTIGDNAFTNASLSVSSDGTIQGTAGNPDSGTLVVNTDGGTTSKLPSGVTSIGDEAFKDSGLVSDAGNASAGLDISDFLNNADNENGSNVSTIGDEAFAGVNIGENKDVVVPDSVTSVGDGSFAVVDSNGDLAAGKHPGINIVFPGNAIAKEPHGDADQGLDDIFMGTADPSTGTPDNRPAFFGDVTITGDENGSFSTDKLTGKDDTTDGVDIVIDGTLDFDGGLTDVTIGDLSNIGVPNDDGNLEIKLPSASSESGEKNTITINGPLAPTKVDNEGKPVADSGSDKGAISFVDETGNSTGLPVGPEIVIGSGSDGEGVFGSSFPSAPETEGSVVDPFWNVQNPEDDLAGNGIVNVTSIGSNAFAGNENITRITIPADCTKIDAGAFAGCTNLKEIIFEGPRETPIDIDPTAFDGCTSLNTVSVLENDKYDMTEGTAKFPTNSVAEFGSGIFDEATFDKVILPPAVQDEDGSWVGSATSVADDAFKKDTPYEVTIPVKGFMHEDSYNGSSPSDEDSENVTFSGTWPTISGVSAVVNGETVSVPEKYGYTGTWNVGSETIVIGDESVTAGSVTISDIVANDGGTISWTPKEISSVKITLPNGWTDRDTGENFITIDVSDNPLKFGDKVPDGFFDELLEKAIKETADGAQEITSVEISEIVENQILSNEALFDSAAENGTVEITLDESDITSSEISYSIQIETATGSSSIDIGYGKTWGDLADNGDFYYSTVNPGTDGKLSDVGSLKQNSDEITAEDANGKYYQYAKVNISYSGDSAGAIPSGYPTAGEGYYQVGTDYSKIFPSVDVPGYTITVPEGSVTTGSATVTINKHQYKVHVDGAGATSVAFDTSLSSIAGISSSDNSAKYLISLTSTVESQLGDSSNLKSASDKLPAQSKDGADVYITTYYPVSITGTYANQIKVDGENLTDPYVKKGATITLPSAPTDLGSNVKFLGWTFSEKDYSAGETIKVEKGYQGVSLVARTETARTVIINIYEDGSAQSPKTFSLFTGDYYPALTALDIPSGAISVDYGGYDEHAGKPFSSMTNETYTVSYYTNTYTGETDGSFIWVDADGKLGTPGKRYQLALTDPMTRWGGDFNSTTVPAYTGTTSMRDGLLAAARADLAKFGGDNNAWILPKYNNGNNSDMEAIHSNKALAEKIFDWMEKIGEAGNHETTVYYNLWIEESTTVAYNLQARNPVPYAYFRYGLDTDPGTEPTYGWYKNDVGNYSTALDGNVRHAYHMVLMYRPLD